MKKSEFLKLYETIITRGDPHYREKAKFIIQSLIAHKSSIPLSSLLKSIIECYKIYEKCEDG